MNNYLKYKKDEIKYLEKEFKVKIPKNYNIIDYLKYKKELFNNRLFRKSVFITNNNKNDFSKLFLNSLINLKYSYLRYDSNIEYINFINSFYHINKRGVKSKTFFTNSGMSAISSVLFAIKNILQEVQIKQLDDDIYFETIDLIKKFNLSNVNGKNVLLYIDTISKRFNIYNYIKRIEDYKNIDMILIDTTCFIPEELKKIINYCIKKNIPIILLRSHTKLDMMASEISSLGSIVYLIPAYYEKISLLKKIILENYYLLGKFGSLSSPNIFPEEIFNMNFKKINFNRIKRIENNNLKLFFYLKNSIKRGEVLLPNHKKFLLYCLSKNLEKNDQLNFLLTKIKKFSNNSEYIFYATSFGFDYIALDAYYDIDIKNFVIRISMNDSLNNKNIFKIIGDFINDNF